MINIRVLDFRSYAVISLLVVWASLTFAKALTEISFVFALVFWIGWHIQLKHGMGPYSPEKEKGAFSPRIDWTLWTPLALFFLFVLVSFFTSESHKESFRGILKIAKPLLVFFMALDLFRNTSSQKRFDGVFLATFLVVIMDCSIQYAFGRDLLRGFAAEQSAAGIRLVGPFGNFAKMATYLVLVIPVFGLRFLSDCFQKQRKRSFLNLTLALAGFTLLYLTRCRGPIVALVLSFGMLLIYRRWFKALGIMIVLCLSLLSVVPRNVLIHQDAEKKEQSIVERFVLWKRAWNVIEAKPWTGIGINAYNVAHAKYDKEKSWRVRGYYAHNGYLQLAAEIGLPGIFCFLFFLFMFFRKVLRSLRPIHGSPEAYDRMGILTGLFAFLIYAAFDNNLQSPPSLMFFWFSAGILMAKLYAEKDR